MVAAETCDCTLCRSVAGCWVSGLCQRSTPLMRLTHTPTALYPSHLRHEQLTRNGDAMYYTKILAQKSMGFEKWTRRAHSAEKTAAQGAAQGAAGDSPLKQAWTDHIFFYTSTLLHGSTHHLTFRPFGRFFASKTHLYQRSFIAPSDIADFPCPPSA